MTPTALALLAAAARRADPDTIHPRTVEEIAALREERIAAMSGPDAESRLPQFRRPWK